MTKVGGMRVKGQHIFEKAIKGTGFENLTIERKWAAKKKFQEEWSKLAVEQKNPNGVITEEGRLWVGIGRKAQTKGL